MHEATRSKANSKRRGNTGLVTFMGWFGIGLGLGELFAGQTLARTLGLDDKGAVLRAYGVREIVSGVVCLTAPAAGIAARIAGDVLDVATALPAVQPGNPERRNGWIAMSALGGAMMLDLLAAKRLSA